LIILLILTMMVTGAVSTSVVSVTVPLIPNNDGDRGCKHQCSVCDGGPHISNDGDRGCKYKRSLSDGDADISNDGDRGCKYKRSLSDGDAENGMNDQGSRTIS
jgi:hypothetical protein